MFSKSAPIMVLALAVVAQVQAKAPEARVNNPVLRQYGPDAGVQRCIQNPSDPYDPGYAITFGWYTGKCVDSSSVRPPLILPADKPGTMKFANFYHQGRYWIATVPEDIKVKKVLAQGIPFDKVGVGQFSAVLAHGQARFMLDKPIVLEEQTGNGDKKKIVLNDLIISSTVTKPEGKDYKFQLGTPLYPSYNLATRVLSSESRGVEEIAVDKSPVHQMELDLDPSVANRLLLTSIKSAAAEGMSGRYDLTKNNCAVSSMRFLDQTLYGTNEKGEVQRPVGVQEFKSKLRNFQDTIMQPALRALDQRQIKYYQIQDMNLEMECGLAGQTVGNRVIPSKSELGAAAGACYIKQTPSFQTIPAIQN